MVEKALEKPALKRDVPTRLAIVGCGSMTRHHLRALLANFDNTTIAVVCEPSAAEYATTAEMLVAAGRPAPPNEPDLARLLDEYGAQLDAVLIVTPHAFHHDQAKACLEAGLDVLLEKPMVMNAAEAESLIDTCQRSGRLLVVAFNGSLSPEIRAAAALLRSGEVGQVLSINASVWQNWRQITAGTWRQVPAIAGGGFLFDTGAHMMNTVVDLAGEEFVEVAAWLDNRGAAVEINAVVIGRLASGALVTLHASGETIESCTSDVTVYCTEAIIRTGIWGRRLQIQRQGEPDFEAVAMPPSTGAWEQFQAVRAGTIANPCPPEIGLRMAHLWDAIQASARQRGRPVTVAGASESVRAS